MLGDMTTRKLIVLSLVASSALAGCKKKDGDSAPKPSEGGSAPATGADPGAGKPAGTGPFADWDMAPRQAAFQGAHVAPGDALGAWQAVKVEGTKVTMWDGTKESTAELELRSPCEAAYTVKGADGSSSSTVAHYTIENGKLVTGLGDAGARKGPAAIACVSNKVVTLDAAGACLEWTADDFDSTKYKSGPGKCAFAKDGDKDVFKATVNGTESTLEVHGDALYTAQIASTHSEDVADWAAAKAARDAKK
jgi:hypothetical protein